MTAHDAGSTANQNLHEAYHRWLRRALFAAGVVHVVVLAFTALPVARPLAETPDDMVSIVDPRYRIPPPPQELARPAIPTVSEEPVAEDVTLSPTDLSEVTPREAEPPAVAPPDVSPPTAFAPYTVAPRCVSGCGSRDVVAHLPSILRRAGVSCGAVVGLHVDLQGRVTEARVLQSSGNEACDRAFDAWARETRWTTAYNRDVPVAVWIAQPVTVSTE